jgi:hypothetical protein
MSGIRIHPWLKNFASPRPGVLALKSNRRLKIVLAFIRVVVFDTVSP